MQHKAQEGSPRKLVSLGCSECAWVFVLSDLPVDKTLDDLVRELQGRLYQEFASHVCADYPRAKRA